MKEDAVIKKSILFGLFGILGILGFYFLVLSLVSGWDYTLVQFNIFKYYILSLAVGFGIQIGLYVYLREEIKETSKKTVIATGTTSTMAMISCCSHYLVNILPIIGIAGLVTIVSQYQTQLFWIGILANLLGIFYMVRKILKVGRILKEPA